MTISSIFAKLKGFGPVAVVGTAVLITIKLLTTKTPTVEESFDVKADEDIAKTTYEEKIEVPPEPQPEPKEEEPEAPQEDQKDSKEPEEEIEEDEAKEDDSEGQEDSEKEEKEKTKEEEKKEQPKRSWKVGGEGSVVNVLQKLLTPPKK